MSPVARYTSVMTVQRKLLLGWFFLGVLPFMLQIRSYLKFATPHKITESLLVPAGAEMGMENIGELCPMKGFNVGQVWWNVDITHYYKLEHDYLCHFVVPQYNSHGNFLIGKEKVERFHTAPAGCANNSYPVELFFYHSSIGYYSFYDELVGAYCTLDSAAYTHVAGLGTFDINGLALAQDPGSDDYRWSYWYSILGAIWTVFRALVLRRSFISCKRYGDKCSQLEVNLRRRAATIFVHESLRLSAHGATNYHRMLLLYLLLEGLMSDLFLLAATDGTFAWVQYASLGYNLSGTLLLIFEMIETVHWMSESFRLFTKRLLFSYESSLIGELSSAVVQSYILTSINHSDLKCSKPVALTVSYYVWGLVGHGVILGALIGFIMAVRILRAITYVRWKFGRTWDILLSPCCVDTTLGARNKMMKLAGYYWEDGKLYYRGDAMKSFGLLKVEEEDGSEFMALRKLGWFEVHQEDLFVIGSVTGQRVEPCSERPCTGVVSFFDRDLGGAVDEPEGPRSQTTRDRNKISPALLSLGPDANVLKN
ncbi:uncharacterized protein KRP23_11564 [Phytophthora ramorum]|uniref:uncharacterized protein n=1 Tax=Phytophthora ramorum TaxID=164328 RepID=UPI0030B1E4C6|nr:hypothetical protein KRP23_11564 [Phytophthora ramorum]